MAQRRCLNRQYFDKIHCAVKHPNVVFKYCRFISFFNKSTKRKEYYAKKLIGYSSEQMYGVVSDVRNYKKFLPFCTKSTILSQQPNQLRANLEVGFPPIIENYTSVVTLKKPHLVEAVCKDGRLFALLVSTWKFNPGLQSNPQSCIVDFSVSFEFQSVLYSQLATFFFDQLVQQMEQAFMTEAQRRFGKESLAVHALESIKR